MSFDDPKIDRFLSIFEAKGPVDGPMPLLDHQALHVNIQNMAAKAAGQASLHPHVKTHKSAAIAHMQKEAGASGFTAATFEEARGLLEAGLGSVTLARPLMDVTRIAQLLVLASEGEIRFICDSPFHIEALVQGAKAAGTSADVFVKVDVGLHRMGVAPRTGAALDLAKLIDAKGLRFSGLLSHAGHAYGGPTPDGIREKAASERRTMIAERLALEQAGIHVPCVSVGSTPSVLADDGFDGIDEMRPGNYVFLDLVAVALGIATRDQLALALGTRVLASHPDRIVIGTGSKALSSDRGPHGLDMIKGFGEAWLPGASTPLTITALSEEHGIVKLGDDGVLPKVGTPVIVLPNHVCPTTNLASQLFASNGQALPIDWRR